MFASKYSKTIDYNSTITLTTNETVEISTPDYPSEYSNYENVVWTVTSPENTVVMFEIWESDVRIS